MSFKKHKSSRLFRDAAAEEEEERALSFRDPFVQKREPTAITERKPLPLAVPSTGTDHNEGETPGKVVAALFCIVGLVASWVGTAQVLQLVQTSPGNTTYNKPVFTTYLVHSCYTIMLLPWFIIRAVRIARGTDDAYTPMADQEHAPSDRHYGSSARSSLDTNAAKARFVATVAVFGLIDFACGWTWYASLPLTAVGANTAIYQGASVWVYILSVIFLKERATLLKTLSVLLAVGGVVLITLFSEGNQVGSVTQTWLGYVLVVVSTILYAIYEVGFKVFGHTDADADDVSDSFLFIGLMGLTSFLFCWPIVWLFDAMSWEAFVFPDATQWPGLLAAAGLDVLFNVFLLAGIYLSSPLFVSVGSMLTVPLAVLLDWLLHSGFLPSLFVFVGMGLVLASFLLLNVAEFRKAKSGETGDWEYN